MRSPGGPGSSPRNGDAWCDLFAEDVGYIERLLGTMPVRETVRAWTNPPMARYPERICDVYDWQMLDLAHGSAHRCGEGPPWQLSGVAAARGVMTDHGAAERETRRLLLA